jgi:hypothetical protein
LVRGWLQEDSVHFYDRLFTPLIALWYLASQRLGQTHTLSQVLADAHFGGADALCSRGKKLSRQLKSLSTAAWSNARQRLPLAMLKRALAHSAKEIGSWADNTCWHGWNVLLLDGSTVRLRSVGNISKDFPPHRNSHGQSYWCLMRVVVGFCLNTGLAVVTSMSACSVGEQTLALEVLTQLGPKTLIVADRNFGIFFLAQAAMDASAQLLVRLTESRARKMARDAKLPWRQSLDRPFKWSPSSKDRANPNSPHQTLEGRLLFVRITRRGFRSQRLFLFTSLTDTELYSAQALLDLYGRRWQVELNLRFVKAQMELGVLECKSAAMAQKEWVAGLLAYNLIRSLMVATAAQAEISVWKLSFSRTRELLNQWIKTQGTSRRDALNQWEKLLRLIGKCRQPTRRRPRPSEPRAKRFFKQDFAVLRGSRALARKKLRAQMKSKS